MARLAVLGAGTAGLACASALCRAGHEVTVFEKHASLAPVGAGLLIQPSGLRAIEALGAGAAFWNCSVPIHRLEGRSHRGWLLVDLPYKGAAARAVSRPHMTRVLLEQALRSGAAMQLSAQVASVRQVADRVEVVVGAQVLAFDGAILATGSGSPLARNCGLSAPASVYPWGALNAMFEVEGWGAFDSLQQRFEGPRKLFGLMPTGFTSGGRQVLSFFWSLPVKALPDWKVADMHSWKTQLLQLWPQSAPVVEQFRTHDQFSFATYRHAWPRRLAAGRICLVGDAAHAMSPQLGLGSTLAMGDALALATALAGQSVEDGFVAYERARMAHVKRFQVLSRLLTPCFQADLPGWWRDVAFATALHVPGTRWLMRKSLEG